MNLKDCIAQDVNVFLDLGEFGEIIDLDDVKLRAQVVKHTAGRKQSEIANKNDNFYIHPEKHNIHLIGDYVTVHFKTADYCRERERIPKNTEYIHLNGNRYRVEESRDEFGLTSLICTADRQNTLKPSMTRMRELYQ